MAKDKTNGENKYLYQTEEFYHELDKLLYDTRFNILLLEPFMRHLLLVDRGTGWHTMELVIREHKLVTIKGADTQKVELPITLISVTTV